MTNEFFPLFLLLYSYSLYVKHRNRQRRMGPRVQISTDHFLKLVVSERNLVIVGPRFWWGRSRLYVMRSGDYYYYTVSKTDLSLPSECKTLESKAVLL